MKEIRLAIAGIGNCASSLVQGIEYYKDKEPVGVISNEVAGYKVGDIKIVAAFDVTEGKVGKDLAEAILEHPNNTEVFCDVPALGVVVERGETHDGLDSEYMSDVLVESDVPPVNVTVRLKEVRADVLICYLPVGSEDAMRYYAQAALDAGVALVNAIPVFIASDPEWDNKFKAAGIPLLGDDIKSQVGATIVHRTLVNLFKVRGVEVVNTSQLNVGGNMDFYNMLDRKRLASKKTSKTQAVTSLMDNDTEAYNQQEYYVHVGPSDYVPWLNDRKWAYIKLSGEGFGKQPIELELKLEVVDSPNSAGVMVDAIRVAKVMLERGIGGAFPDASSFFFKSPPVQLEDMVALERLTKFIGD